MHHKGVKTTGAAAAAMLLPVLFLAAVAAAATLARPEEPAATRIAAAVAPPETREVVAEGRAAIGRHGGVPGAREAAIAQALRAAVEQATGVFVSARTLTHNYRLLQDEVTTRAEGFATLKEVVSEKVLPDAVRVRVRALVSLRPLAERLKALKLTRAWRVFVAAPSEDEATPATFERTLVDAGFVVVEAAKDADVVVRVSPRFTTVQETPLETAAGAMTLHSVRGELTVKATRAGTNEIIAAFTGADVAAHIDADAARASTAERVLSSLAPRLADALLLLPAQAAQPVTLVVANLTKLAQVGELHDALRSLPGVRSVTRRGWKDRAATWELDVTTDAVSLLARALEDDVDTRPFRLVVTSESRSRITARLGGAAAAGSVRRR
jgi:hypothetical protein